MKPNDRVPPWSGVCLTDGCRSARMFKIWHVHFVCALIVLLVGVWLSTGTMALYGATLDSAIVTTPCHYLVNIDHGHFKAVFLMLDGASRDQWQWSVYLRRVLHPLLAYPLMKLYGFELGGVLCNVGLQVATFALFAYFLKRRFGERVAILGIWLLALYPGIHYWVGLPYSQATIVPCSLIGMMILWHLNEEHSFTTMALACLLMGMLFLAYDLFPFFGLAAILVLLVRKRLKLVPIAAGLLALPSLVWNWILVAKYGIYFVNSSTAAYPNIIHSYLSRPDFSQWGALLKDFPAVTFENYFFSNFLFLPVLFLALIVCGFLLRKNKDHVVVPEGALLISGLLLYLFLNLAPPYPGWQMRGMWIPRLYQPVFVALLTFSARTLGSLWVDPRKPLANIGCRIVCDDSGWELCHRLRPRVPQPLFKHIVFSFLQTFACQYAVFRAIKVREKAARSLRRQPSSPLQSLRCPMVRV